MNEYYIFFFQNINCFEPKIYKYSRINLKILINCSFKTLELVFYSLAGTSVLHFLRQENRKFS